MAHFILSDGNVSTINSKWVFEKSIYCMMNSLSFLHLQELFLFIVFCLATVWQSRTIVCDISFPFVIVKVHAALMCVCSNGSHVYFPHTKYLKKYLFLPKILFLVDSLRVIVKKIRCWISTPEPNLVLLVGKSFPFN